jgi:hypothetical protein
MNFCKIYCPFWAGFSTGFTALLGAGFSARFTALLWAGFFAIITALF